MQNLNRKLRIVMQHQFFFRNSQNRSRCLIWKCRAWRIADAGVIWSNNQFSGFQPRPHLTCSKILSSQHRLCCHTWKCRVWRIADAGGIWSNNQFSCSSTSSPQNFLPSTCSPSWLALPCSTLFSSHAFDRQAFLPLCFAQQLFVAEQPPPPPPQVKHLNHRTRSACSCRHNLN